MNMVGKKIPPAGCQSFKRMMRGHNFFVDKTFFIQRLIEQAQYDAVFLFTRPRRFGKTLMLDMVKTFFEDEDAEANRQLFNGLQIEQAGAEYMAEQGQYPVISLSFAAIKPTAYGDFEIKMTSYLRGICSQFYYLMESDVLNRSDKVILEEWCTPNIKLVKYTEMLSTLSQWLQRVHPQNHPVVLLIDEYDTPLQVAYENGYYDKALSFFRDFLCNGLKTNKHLKFAVMTGILRVTKESIFSGLNNFIPNTIFDEKYSDVFGFTQGEIDLLLEYYECQDKKDEVTQWYDGYNFGGRQIYNPWSVLSYLAGNCRATCYWINTSSNTSILQACANLYDAQDYWDLEQLLLGRVLQGESIDISVTYGDGLRERSAALGYLLMAGYLKASVSTVDSELYDISVPNYEVRRAFKNDLLRRTQSQYRVSEKFLREFPKAIVSGDLVRFQELLQEYILKVCSVYDGASGTQAKAQRPESFYHGLMVGLSAAMSDYYSVKSNLESGLGRPDLLLLPRSDPWQPENLPVIVMEFKKAAPGDDLVTKAQEALTQIQERQYSAGVDRNRARLLYGLAFRGKKVVIASKSL